MANQLQVPIYLTDAGVQYASEKLHIPNLTTGQELMVKINVAVCITATHNSQRHVCLGKKPSSSEWTFPGGKVERNEEHLNSNAKLRESIPKEYKADSDTRFVMKQESMSHLTRHILLGGAREVREETSIDLLGHDVRFRLLHRPEIFPQNLEYDFCHYLSVVIFSDLGCVEKLPGLASKEFEKVEWVRMGKDGVHGYELRPSTKMWLQHVWESY